jgi:hypothetical protein
VSANVSDLPVDPLGDELTELVRLAGRLNFATSPDILDQATAQMARSVS